MPDLSYTDIILNFQNQNCQRGWWGREGADDYRYFHPQNRIFFSFCIYRRDDPLLRHPSTIHLKNWGSKKESLAFPICWSTPGFPTHKILLAPLITDGGVLEESFRGGVCTGGWMTAVGSRILARYVTCNTQVCRMVIQIFMFTGRRAGKYIGYWGVNYEMPRAIYFREEAGFYVYIGGLTELHIV